MAGQNDKQDQSADQADVPIHPGRWRAGGSGNTPGAEGGLLASLKPMILQLVKEAVQQAVQELLGSGFSLSGQTASADSQPRPQSESNKPGRKPKGKGTGDDPPVQARSDQAPGKGGKKGNKGKSSDPGQPKPQVETGGRGSGKAGKPKPTEQGQKGAGQSKPDADGWVQVRRKAAAEDFRLLSQDWDKPLLEYGRLAEALDALKADKILEAVILCTSSEAKVAQTMIVGSGKQYSVLLIVPGKTTTSQRVPGRVGESRKFIDADVCRFVSQGQTGPRVFGTQKPVTITTRKTAVLFVRVPKIYCTDEQWKTFKKTPQKTMMTWTASRNILAVDTFGWKEQKSEQGHEQLFGLVRIEETDIEPVLGHSGSGSVFIEPPRKVLATRIEWVEHDKNESHADYFTKASRGKGALGLAVCGRSIGWRSKLNAEDQVTRMWIIRGLPVSWGMGEAKTMVSEHFKEVHMVNARSDKGGKSFLFKGIYHQGAHRDIAPVSAIIDGRETTLWAEWAPPKQRKIVQRSLPKGAVPFVAEPSLLKLVATKPPDPVKLDDEGKEISDPKRKCTPAKVRPVPEKLVYRKMAKDGSCVFHAMAAGIKFVTGGKLDLSARELRARAVGHLRKYADTYSKQYDKKGPDGSDMPEFEDYLNAIAAESAYAGAMEVEALCRIYSVRVILVPENAAFPVEAYHLKEKKKTVVLWLTGMHIDLLLPEGADAAEKEGADTRKLRYPQELLEIAATPTIAYKVGGVSRGDQATGTSSKRSIASVSSTPTRAKGSVQGKGFRRACGSRTSCAPSSAQATDWTAPSARPGKPPSTADSKFSVCTSWTAVSACASTSAKPRSKGANTGQASGSGPVLGSDDAPSIAETDWTNPEHVRLCGPMPKLSALRPEDVISLVSGGDDRFPGVPPCSAKPDARSRDHSFVPSELQQAYYDRVGHLHSNVAQCRLCPFRRLCNSNKCVSAVLSAHFKQAHPGQKPGGDTRRLSCVRPLGKDEAALWRCPFCDCGISKQEGGRFGAALIARFKKAHKIEKHAQVTWKCWRRKKYEDAERSERILVTKHNARQIANLQLIDEMRAQDFTAFPWPRLGPKTATLSRSICVNLSWRCNKCQLPLRTVGEAKKHRQNHGYCPSASASTREPARLLKLRKVRELLRAYPVGFARERLTHAFSAAEQALQVSEQEV